MPLLCNIMIELAYNFAAWITFFPFILIFVVALLFVLTVPGCVLFITGIKSKSLELTKAERKLKIIKIIIGIILLVTALLIIVFIVTGFIVAHERGGVLANNKPSSNPDEGGAILQYLEIILLK